MKKTKIMPLLLGFVLLAPLVLPAVPARAAEAENGGSDSSDSVHFEKKVDSQRNEDGTYTITLEAYATGEKIISTVTKDVPTDIVLVLEMSSSMREDFGTVSYSVYSNLSLIHI